MSMTWNEYFMTFVFDAALKSKDELTKIGAIIVTPDNHIVSTGYNSFPTGINDHFESRQQRPNKYFYMEHSERNAIYAAAKKGIHTEKCVMYTMGMPCADCARAIIQSGIKAVWISDRWEREALKEFSESWSDSRNAAKVMLDEAGVDVCVNHDMLNKKFFMRGKWHDEVS